MDRFFKSVFSVSLLILLTTMTITTCRHTRSNHHRLRHSNSRNQQRTSSARSDERSSALAGIEQHILNSLGLQDTPNVRNVVIPDHMKEILREEIMLENSESKEEKHFMADNANILQTSSKVHTDEYGETMLFTLSTDDQAMNMMDIKLYYHVNPVKVIMTANNEAEPMNLKLTALNKQADGTLRAEVINDQIHIHSHLVGWHNEQIPAKFIRQAYSKAAASSNATVQFQLSCTNCNYQVFPEVITKQNVPFLTMNGRRRSRRNGQRGCTGSCCLKELIVDFTVLGPRWDFVIYPRRYVSNYCTGSCLQPAPTDRAQMTSNTLLINMMLGRQQAAASTSCCVAADEESIMMAYYDDTGRVRTNRNSLKKIKSCRCASSF